ALRKLGWNDDYIAWGHLEAEAELVRLKDGKFYVVNSNALFEDGLPIQKEIDAAAKQAGSKYPGQTMTEGWIGGMAIEAALKAAGAAGRSCGPRTTTSARSSTTASISGTAARSRACRTGRTTR